MPGGINNVIPILVCNPEGINKWNENEVTCKQALCIEIISFTGDYTILLLWKNKQPHASVCLRNQKS